MDTNEDGEKESTWFEVFETLMVFAVIKAFFVDVGYGLIALFLFCIINLAIAVLRRHNSDSEQEENEEQQTIDTTETSPEATTKNAFDESHYQRNER